MRRPSFLLALSALMTLAVPLVAQPPGCPPAGDAKGANERALNMLKNRPPDIMTTDIDPEVSLAALLAPGPDRVRWDTRRAGRIVGYVRGVRVGNVASATCHATGEADRETHLELVPTAADANNERLVIVVAVTPATRALAAARGEDWSTAALGRRFHGRTVLVTGWMMFDTEHANDSVNSAPGATRVSRGSAWGLHGLREIRVVQGTRPSG